MKAALAAAAAFFAIGAAATALAQTAPVPAPPAPAINYVSPCKAPSDAEFPTVPDPLKANNASVFKANKAYDAFQSKVATYRDCKSNELKTIQGEVDAAQAKSPKSAMVKSFNAQMTNLNKGSEAYKATGLPMPALTGQINKPGKCGAAPSLDPAPAIPTAAEVPTMKKGDVRKMTAAYVKWASPRYVYVMCMRSEAEAAANSQTEDTAPQIAKFNAAKAEYDAFHGKVTTLNGNWRAYSDAYSARLKKAAGGH